MPKCKLQTMSISFMTTEYPTSGDCVQQENTLCPKTRITSGRFLEHDSEFPVLKMSLHSPHLNPTEHRCNVWNRRFTSRMCRQQIFSNCMMLSYQCDSKSLRNDSSTLLNLLNKEWRGSVSKRGWKIRLDQQSLKRFEVVRGKLYLKVPFLQIIYMLRKQVNNCTWQH